MKQNSALALTGLAMFSSFTLAAEEHAAKNTTSRPNIIFFLVDDYGWLDSSVAYGEEIYPNNMRVNTPNMQRLADKGVIMTNAYACPLSSPTRTSLMTGMHAAHEKINMFTAPEKDTPTDFTGGTRGFFSEASAKETPGNLARPEWNYNGISPEPGVPHTVHITPMVKQLRDAGYYTIHIGKGHWASIGTPGVSPYNMGFIVNVAGNMAGMPRSYYAEEHFGNYPGKWTYSAINDLEEYYGTEKNLTQALTDKALKSLDYPISKGEPFYLYMSHYGVHTPIHSEPQFIQKYLDRGMEQKTAEYCSMVESVDESLGQIMDYLEKKNIADNTIIVFYSDNGGHSLNDAKNSVPHTFNAPLREGKGSVYEGGVRVPMMVYWPGKTAAGMRINTPVMPQDFYPSICEMAGIKNTTQVQPIDGQSFVKLVTDGSQLAAKAVINGRIKSQKDANAFVVPQSVSGIDPERAVISHMPHQWRIEEQNDVDFMSAIRKGDWKLVYRMRNGKLELYNLKNDISERNDLASQNPDIVRRLANELSGQLRRWEAPMPVVKATGKLVPLPDELNAPVPVATVKIADSKKVDTATQNGENEEPTVVTIDELNKDKNK